MQVYMDTHMYTYKLVHKGMSIYKLWSFPYKVNENIWMLWRLESLKVCSNPEHSFMYLYIPVYILYGEFTLIQEYNIKVCLLIWGKSGVVRQYSC